jgi:hypothetical protein
MNVHNDVKVCCVTAVKKLWSHDENWQQGQSLSLEVVTKCFATLAKVPVLSQLAQSPLVHSHSLIPGASKSRRKMKKNGGNLGGS